ncbi:hypothetical protein [Streptomyces canus]|uniref:hypothetical protein n=1 Tax=Streptomyces canus TaxID=58343 RepID=UPI00371BE25F
MLDDVAQDVRHSCHTRRPLEVPQTSALRAVAAERREHALTSGTLIAAVRPVDTASSRPWFIA